MEIGYNLFIIIMILNFVFLITFGVLSFFIHLFIGENYFSWHE